MIPQRQIRMMFRLATSGEGELVDGMLGAVRRRMGTLARLLVAAGATAAVVASAGCAPHSDYMREVETPVAQPKAPSDAALVYFVRPSSFAYLATYEVVDVRVMPNGKPEGTGHFLGDSLASTHFAAVVPAGEHYFVAFHESDPIARNDAMRASLAPGRVYFVEIAPNIAGVSILAITPRSDSWQHVRGWIADTKELAPDRPGGEAYLADHPDDVRDEITHALEHLTDDNPEELAERTITAGDGVVP